MIVQLINDDGPNSPLLSPFLERLRKFDFIAELRVVIPATDKSWIGSALTRKSKITVTQTTIADCKVHLVSGTPADCANLGVHTLFPSKPDIVLSGPNLGQNAGGPFTICSGTLGGAIVASLSRINAIAISSELTPEIWSELLGLVPKDKLQDRTAQWAQIADVSAEMFRKSVVSGAYKLGAVVNINLPWGAGKETEVMLTKIQGGQLPAFFSRVSEDTLN